jgi:hypothetical protein
MSRDAQRKTINGHEWEVTPWDAMHGLRMQARIAPIVQAALGASEGSVMDMDVAKVTSAILSRIDAEETPRLIRDALHGVFVDGKDMSMDKPFNDLFAANYGELYQGLWFVVQTNLGDLFSMAGVTGTPDAPAAQGAENSPAS